MIVFQCATFQQYLEIRESHPQFFTSGNPTVRPPVKAGVKGECEKAYNAEHGIFRFTDEQKAIHDTLPTEKERAEFRELKCAECLAAGKRNGWKEGDKMKAEKVQGESEQGETWQGEEVEPSEEMFN